MATKEQNFKNHGRLVPAFHIFTFLAMIAAIVGSVISIVYSNPESLLISWMLFLLTLIIISVAFFARSFSLRAQDRAIRAEENLRYFILTGKRLDSRITMRQIIALRFASDDEFVELVNKAIDKNLSQKEIKETIKNWKADHHRA